MIKYLKIFRPLNLAIIVATILVIWFKDYYFLGYGNTLDYLTFIIVSVLIASSGNLHNDYLDQENDKVNKPNKTFPFSNKTFWITYVTFNVIAIILAYIQFRFIIFIEFFLFPIVALYIYNTFLKKIALLGNLTIALLSALIIVLSFELRLPQQNLELGIGGRPTSNATVYTTLLIISSFLITLSREIIKDTQDIKGDKQSNYKTLPIITSIHISKLIASIPIVITLYFIIDFALSHRNLDSLSFFHCGLLSLTLTASIYYLLSKSKYNIKNASFLLKLSMGIALIILITL